MSKEQPVIIIVDRHPQSVGNISGDHRNDSTLSITDLGRAQARAQADFMVNELFPRLGITQMPQIWASPYVRVREGLDEKLGRIAQIAPNLIDPKQIIHFDDMLSERNFGKLAYADHLINDVFKNDPIAQKAIIADMTGGKAVYDGTPHSARPAHGESHKDIGGFTRLFRETLQRDIEEGANIHWISTHGDVIKQLVAKQLHQHLAPMPTPGNCDVIVFAGTSKNMTVQRVYDGEAMQSCFQSPKYRTKPTRVGDMPFAREFDQA